MEVIEAGGVMSEQSLPGRIPRPLVADPSAWVGADMARTSDTWTYNLSPNDLEEIDRARDRVLASGMNIADIRRRDFPLPALGGTLERLRRDVLAGRGFVLIRGLAVRERSMRENAIAFLGVGAYFGAS